MEPRLYGNFLETVNEILPMYWMRAIEVACTLLEWSCCFIILWLPSAGGSKVTDELAEAAPLQRVTKNVPPRKDTTLGLKEDQLKLTIYATVAILIGGMVQIIPSLIVDDYMPKDYECKTLHPLNWKVGTFTSVKVVMPVTADDTSFQKRSGTAMANTPSLVNTYTITHSYGAVSVRAPIFRVGGKYNDNWHFNHVGPTNRIWRFYAKVYLAHQNELTNRWPKRKWKAMVTLGVPYTEEDIANAQKIDGWAGHQNWAELTERSWFCQNSWSR